MAGLITSDHGYWGAQLIEPYVDEEVSWAVRHHQALRYFPDESVGYSYPEAYIRYFRHRFVPLVANHLLQSARLAEKAGLDASGRIMSRQPIFAKPMSRHAGTHGT